MESQPQAQLLILLATLSEEAILLLVIVSLPFYIEEVSIWYIFDCQESCNSYNCMSGISKLQVQESLHLNLQTWELHSFALFCYSNLKLITIELVQRCFLFLTSTYDC